MRNFIADILDNDGEVQEYKFIAADAWRVTYYIMLQMDLKGDFYGHLREDTIMIRVGEQTEDADMTGAIQL